MMLSTNRIAGSSLLHSQMCVPHRAAVSYVLADTASPATTTAHFSGFDWHI
jgi:hypothetical protein